MNYQKTGDEVIYNKERTILFSGRFDRPNIGHIANLMRLGQEYKKVIIPVLDYQGQMFDPYYRASIIENILNMAFGEYNVLVNTEHFGRITKEELSKYKFDVYGSGNHECLMHMHNLGYPTVYVERAYDYTSTEGRLLKKLREAL